VRYGADGPAHLQESSRRRSPDPRRSTILM
jgi:hypothetical protein